MYQNYTLNLIQNGQFPSYIILYIRKRKRTYMRIGNTRLLNYCFRSGSIYLQPQKLALHPYSLIDIILECSLHDDVLQECSHLLLNIFRATTRTQLSFTLRTEIIAKTFGRNVSSIILSSDVWQLPTEKEKNIDYSAKDPHSGKKYTLAFLGSVENEVNDGRVA